MRKTDEELKAEFTPLQDTHSPAELAEIDNSQHYGHDVINAISRAQNRRRTAALDEAEKWTTANLRGIASDPESPNTLFWHLLCELVCRAEKQGMTKEDVKAKLKRQIEVIDYSWKGA